jgi:hypothetical protein
MRHRAHSDHKARKPQRGVPFDTVQGRLGVLGGSSELLFAIGNAGAFVVPAERFCAAARLGCKQELSETVNLLWLCYDGVC